MLVYTCVCYVVLITGAVQQHTINVVIRILHVFGLEAKNRRVGGDVVKFLPSSSIRNQIIKCIVIHLPWSSGDVMGTITKDSKRVKLEIWN
jgi:hypothetical protein